jgi:hypothetical protein
MTHSILKSSFVSLILGLWKLFALDFVLDLVLIRGISIDMSFVIDDDFDVNEDLSEIFIIFTFSLNKALTHGLYFLVFLTGGGEPLSPTD